MTHSKYLNSGIINNLFQSVLISEMINNNDYNDQIKQYIDVLKKSPLIMEEINIYNQILDTCIDKPELADKFLMELNIDIKSKLSNNMIKERQKFYEDVRKVCTIIESKMDSKIKKYKIFASINNYIDNQLEVKKLNALERTSVNEVIKEHLINNKTMKRTIQMIEESNKLPKEVDPLVVDIMIKEFKNKWEKTLSKSQYQYLIEYISVGKSINSKWLSMLKRKLGTVNYKLISDHKTVDNLKTFVEELNTKRGVSSEELLEYLEVYDEVRSVLKENKIEVK